MKNSEISLKKKNLREVLLDSLHKAVTPSSYVPLTHPGPPHLQGDRAHARGGITSIAGVFVVWTVMVCGAHTERGLQVAMGLGGCKGRPREGFNHQKKSIAIVMTGSKSV